MELKLDRRNKIIFAAVIVFLLIDTVILGFRYATNRYSKATLGFDNSSVSGLKLRALNGEAVSGRIKKNGYAYYRFTEEEKKLLQDYYRHVGALCISARIGVRNVSSKEFDSVMASEKLFYFGFLTADEFSSKGKFEPVSKRVLSGCDLRSFIRPEKGLSFFDNGFALEKNLKDEQLPEGFVIYSSYPVKIVDFLVQEAKVGFDYTKGIPFFGVSSNGGSFGGNVSVFDFSGCTTVFPVENTRYTVMPKIEMGFFPSKDYGTMEEQLYVSVKAGVDNLRILRTKDVSECVVQASTLNTPFSLYELNENGNLISKILMTPNDSSLAPSESGKVLMPLKTDPGLILTSRQANWRNKDYEVYEWNRFPGLLFFDTADYGVQSDFFTRLAFFAEKTGYKGRILSDEELGDMHGYNAHDYSAESLASFFTKAERSGVKLNEKELILKDILLKNQIIIPDNYTYKAGSGAVISISRESQNWLRQNFVAHEAWHGIFFTNEDFRNAVAAVYYTVDGTTMAFLKGFWASQSSLGYDQSDEYLMHNEFMAYLMQQPLSQIAKYFVHCAERGSVMTYQKELCQWVISNGGITFEDAGRVLNSYAFDNWGLAAGRVSLILRQGL